VANYTGVGSGAVNINLGWEPQFVLVKNASRSADWALQDTMRGMSHSEWNLLVANKSQAELDISTDRVVPTATGFTVNNNGSSDFGQSGDNVIYIAIRRGPMRAPESGTEVFTPITRTSGLPSFVSSFPVDMALVRKNITATGGVYNASRLTGTKFLYTNTTDAEANDNGFVWDFMDGWANDGGTSSNVISWNFRRAPGFFDVVAYTGNGVAGRTVPHNLGVAPEMLIFKRRDATRNWAIVHHEAVNRTVSQPPVLTGYDVSFNFDVSGGLGGVLNSTAPTADVVTLGSSPDVNVSGGTYIAYLFATLAGVSKVGSYTGTGTTLSIDCGFTAGARFVLIKRCDDEGDWYVWDTARGIIAGNDPYLLLNSTAAEVTNTDYIDPLSSGFQISSTAPAAINASGGSYIFLAIA
jgi:hypothetical protein